MVEVTDKDSIKIDGIELVRTCYACPEQYDAFDESNRKVGYLRLRHGTFYAECPDVGGEEVYCTQAMNGDGIFDADERMPFLKKAVNAINQWRLRETE